MRKLSIRDHPSPNRGPRRGGARPDMIVLHYTAMADPEAVLARLCNPASEVSAHYLIDRAGDIWRLVDEADRAWHAGAGCWGRLADINSHSIGIELLNRGDEPFQAAQMRALEGLMAEIMARHAIAPERVIGHSDMAPARKGDPGRRFDWRRLARGGLSVWPEAPDGGIAPGEARFTDWLARFGYGRDAPAEALLAAFRLRFRPGASGPLDGRDMALARDLARRFPVDRTPRSA